MQLHRSAVRHPREAPSRTSPPATPFPGRVDTGTVSEQPSLADQLLRFGPRANAHRVALRAGLSILVSLLVLWSMDRLEWSIYAAFGAFTSLYGRNHVHPSPGSRCSPRWR